MKKDDSFFLRYLIEDAVNIRDNLVTKEEFEEGVVIRAALLKFAENIGEGSKHISEELKEKTKDAIPWREWSSFRNRTVHGYFSLDYDIVYDALLDIASKVAVLQSIHYSLGTDGVIKLDLFRE